MFLRFKGELLKHQPLDNILTSFTLYSDSNTEGKGRGVIKEEGEEKDGAPFSL